MAPPSNPGRQNLASFQFIIDYMEHESYLGWTLHPSLSQFILAQDNNREAADWRSIEPPPPSLGAELKVAAPRS